MLQTKLPTYIASTLLANTLIGGLLPPVPAMSAEPIEPRNPVEKLALKPSFPTDADGIELDLDSILATEFEQKGFLLARCCF
jgi:hypothetical protein